MKLCNRILSTIFLTITFYTPTLIAQVPGVITVDICIYGGSSAGVIAAYTAKKMGKSVILVEPGIRLGGLTSGGLGMTDIGNKYAVTGISLDFYRRIGRHYGKLEQWTFEPQIAKQLFEEYIQKANVDILYQNRLVAVSKKDGQITEIKVENVVQAGTPTQVIKAKMFIDCTYEGDLMAKSGVSYTIGRESNSTYNETYNGVQLRDKHQFPDGIDPYRTPGVKESGLLWGVSDEELAPAGSGDKKVQTYNIRVCLTNSPANRIAITQPDDYKPERYELLLRLLEKKPASNLRGIMTLSRMPNDKTDINNSGPFSTDMIGMNWNFPEAGYSKRNEIQKAHDNYTKGFFYFIGHDPRVPEHLRKEMLEWGYPKDEYVENGNWTPQMYVREARRMVGEYVMTQANCEGQQVVADGVGLAAYTMDSHNCQRIVVDGMVKNEGDVQIGGFDPYPISYRSLIPKQKECKNLLVPVCLSASHIAYGSIRMEPVFMVLAQSSAVAASLAIDGNKSVQEVDVLQLQTLLKDNPLADGSNPDILIDNEDSVNLIIKGSWTKGKKGGYGPTYLVANSEKGTGSSVKFTPLISQAKNYEVYTYYPKLETGSEETVINVFDGQKQFTRTIAKSKVQVVGQTSGEWVSLGRYKFSKGNKAFVEITGKGGKGDIVADAILLVATD
ncbi:FAD-dependent oxidoreductase [Flavitalea antarctica]